jgi:hypothetical protein
MGRIARRLDDHARKIDARRQHALAAKRRAYGMNARKHVCKEMLGGSRVRHCR